MTARKTARTTARRSLAARLTLTSLLVLTASPAAAWGPGVHLRECERVAERMIAEAHPLAKAVGPAYRAWLRVGCIAPDLRQAVPQLDGTPTHAPGFGWALVQDAQAKGAPDGAIAFAIGALAHQASDGAESVFAGHATASALLGAPDIFPGVEDGMRAECELMTEILGEFANGRADLLLLLLDDLGVFAAPGSPSKLNWQPMLGWYVERLVAFGAKPKGSVAETVAALQGVIAKAAAKAGPLGKDAVSTLLTLMAAKTGAENLALLAALPIGDALAAVGMAGLDESTLLDPAHFRAHARLAFFGEAGFLQAAYATLSELGPHWTLRRLAGKHVEAEFPGWNGPLMAGGIRASLAHGMPKTLLTAESALLFDRVEWRSLAAGVPGAAIASWAPGDGPIRLRVRLFAATKGSWRVALQVRQATPGFAASLGAMVTETSAVLALDPMDAEDVARPWLELDVDPSAAVGQSDALVAVLARAPADAPAGAEVPWALGQFEPYAAFCQLDVGGAAYHPWHDTLPPLAQRNQAILPGLALPPLPKTHPAMTVGSTLVRVVDAPLGNLVVGIEGRVWKDGALVATLGESAPGRLLLANLPPGSYALVVRPLAKPAALQPVGPTLPTPDGPAFAVEVAPGGRDVVSPQVQVLLLAQNAALIWDDGLPGLGATGDGAVKGTVQVDVAPLQPYGDQDLRVQLALLLPQSATPLVEPWPVQALLQTQATTIDAPTPAAKLRYSVRIARQALLQALDAVGGDGGAGSDGADGSGGVLALQVGVRLLAWPIKSTATPPATAWTPWSRVALALPEPAAGPDAGGGDDIGPPPEDAAQDAAHDATQDDAAPDAAAAPTDVAADTGPDGGTTGASAKARATGCAAASSGAATPGPRGHAAALLLLAGALVALRRTRRRGSPLPAGRR